MLMVPTATMSTNTWHKHGTCTRTHTRGVQQHTFRFNSTSAFFALFTNNEYGMPCWRTPAFMRSIHSLRKSLFLFCQGELRTAPMM